MTCKTGTQYKLENCEGVAEEMAATLAPFIATEISLLQDAVATFDEVSVAATVAITATLTFPRAVATNSLVWMTDVAEAGDSGSLPQSLDSFAVTFPGAVIAEPTIGSVFQMVSNLSGVIVLLLLHNTPATFWLNFTNPDGTIQSFQLDWV